MASGPHGNNFVLNAAHAAYGTCSFCAAAKEKREKEERDRQNRIPSHETPHQPNRYIN